MHHMLIRESNEADIPAIVVLLKKSLGETSSPKSIDYWVWKHINNPFGESMVFLGLNNGQLIGVRAMMRWNWQRGNDSFNALRAVDTGTHPDHQGTGVFSTLTKKIVGLAHNQGINFIFNTPNSKTLPGYLKLGWISLGKLRVGVSFLPSFFGFHSTILDELADFSCLYELCKSWNTLHQSANHFFTPKTPEYLKWRYLSNPVINYFVHSDSTLFLAMYIRKRTNFTELRIAELICMGNKPVDRKKVKLLVRQWAFEKKVNLITFAPQIKSWMPGFAINLPIGPILTTKKINIGLPSFEHEKMAYQLGDMELF
jgi:GNAT superfamily N-acetyltransferase